MQAVADEAGVTKPVVYACFDSKDDLFRSLLAREEQRIVGEIQGAFSNADLSDPETTLVEGFTGFLRAAGDSPEVYRLIFLGEGGGNAAVADRIQRGREEQVRRLTELAKGWLESNGNGKRSKAEIEPDGPAARQLHRRTRRVRRPSPALGRGRLDARDARPRARAPRGGGAEERLNPPGT